MALGDLHVTDAVLRVPRRTNCEFQTAYVAAYLISSFVRRPFPNQAAVLVSAKPPVVLTASMLHFRCLLPALLTYVSAASTVASHQADTEPTATRGKDLSYDDIRGRPVNVAYDSRAVTIDGERVLLRSGCVHYARSTPLMWPTILAKAKTNGINTIETYVFWNVHEHAQTPGKYDFIGRRDLRRFLQLCADTGLFVTLRIGPYVCAEWDYGGLPLWLQYEPGIHLRSYNQPWMEAMQAWMNYVIDYVRPFYAQNGGPIILSQVSCERLLGHCSNYGCERWGAHARTHRHSTRTHARTQTYVTLAHFCSYSLHHQSSMSKV